MMVLAFLAMMDSDVDKLNAISHMGMLAKLVPLAPFIVAVIAVIAPFAFLSVWIWTRMRLAERKAYYHAEMMKKIAETGGNSALEYFREQDRIAAAKRMGGRNLGGLVCIAVGLALMIYLGAQPRGLREGDYLAGTIPLFIGLALLAYGRWFAPTPAAENSDARRAKGGDSSLRSE